MQEQSRKSGSQTYRLVPVWLPDEGQHQVEQIGVNVQDQVDLGINGAASIKRDGEEYWRLKLQH